MDFVEYDKLYDELSQINPTLTLDETKSIYQRCISYRQSYVANICKYYEKYIKDMLLTINLPLTIHEQVRINNEGIIVNNVRSTAHIIDIIISLETDIIIDTHISQYVMISVKKSSRERWRQDDFTFIHKPNLYLYCCFKNDYPSSIMFQESNQRKILTSESKVKDDRLYKLSIDNLVYEVYDYFNKVIHEKITYIDLCCGIGSFHYSVMKSDYRDDCRLLMACDILDSSIQTYRMNYNVNVLKDIYSIDFSLYTNMTDIIFAGVPCQSFSSIGKRNGLDDNNGEIILYLINHILPTVRPKFLVIENVKGLLTHDNSKTFNYILDLIKKQNYHVVYKLIACYNYGIPQNRQRLFIICSIEDISQESFDKYLNDTMIPSRTLSEYLGKPFERDIAYTIRCGGLGSPITSKQNWDGYIVDGEEYRLTLEDKLLLQGFDLDFRLYGNNKERSNLVGNTIPTNLSKIIAEFVCEYLI